MRLISQKTIYSGWGRYVLIDVQMNDGSVVLRQVDDHGLAASVLPFDPHRKTALLALLERAGPLFLGEPPRLMEAAAGIIDPGEDAETAARREAMEELGVRLGVLEFAGRVYTSPSVCTEIGHLYLAPYAAADRVAKGGGLAAEHEEIEVVEVALAELARQADVGEIRDMKTLALIQTLRVRRPELF